MRIEVVVLDYTVVELGCMEFVGKLVGHKRQVEQAGHRQQVLPLVVRMLLGPIDTCGFKFN